jgi:serine/threonine protein phosphatase PrpC
MLITFLLLLCSSMTWCMNNEMQKYGVAEMKGRRPTMEDAHRVAQVGEKIRFFGLFDGHGGHDVAAFAAEKLHTHCNFATCETADDVKRVLEEAFLKTHQDLDNASFDARTKGSTALVAVIGSNELFVANAGDCRAVLATKNQDGRYVATALSEDHKANQIDERKRIEALGGMIEYCWSLGDHYVEGVLAVSRALGDKSLHPYVIPTPEIKHKTLEPNDEFLILGCDGVWDALRNDHAVAVVEAELKKNPNNFEKAAASLRDCAFSLGSTDNISVIVVGLKDLHKE